MKNNSFIRNTQHVLCMTSLILSLLFLQEQAFGQQALATSWTGYADTKTAFSNFLSGEHTISFAFMPQFPNASYGPIIAENGTGVFCIGMGDYFENGDGPKLYLEIGSKRQSYPTTLSPGSWYRMAVVCTPTANTLEFKLYLNGAQLGSALSVSKTDSKLPSGNLRFGKRTTGQTIQGKNAQFYGLLDDVAIFKKSATAAEITTLAGLADIGNLPGGALKTAMLASFNFSVNNPVLKGAAQFVGISASKSAASDKSKMILPTAHREMNLPIPRGEAWYVIQGCDDAGGSHKGYASFCWDLMVDGHPQTGAYPNGTAGAPVRAAASGKVVTVQQGKGSGQSPANMVEIQQDNAEICAYLHIQKNSSLVTVNNQAGSGDQLAKTGDVGAAVGANHIHIAVTDKPDGTSGFVTYPVAFSDYEVRQPNGTWKTVSRGMPQKGEVIRIPPVPDLPFKVVAAWRPVARDEIQLYGATFADFKKKYDAIWPQGWRLDQIRTHVFGGQLMYTGVWRKGTEAETQVYGWKYDDFRKKYDELWPQGWRLALLDVSVVNGVPLYTAVWRKSTTAETQVYGWTYDDFRKKYDELWPQGWRLKFLVPYVQNNQVRYTAAWLKSTTAEVQVYGWKYADFRKKYDELWPQGWRLEMLGNYSLGGDVLYSAVWRKSNQGEVQVYEWKYADFRNKYDHLWKDGWRLKLLNVY